MSDLTIVMYHYVRPMTGPVRLNALRVDAFHSQLDYIGTHYEVIGAAELIRARRSGTPLPANAALLTFDDGYADHHRHVLPALRKRKLTAVFYVPSQVVLDLEPLDANKIHFLLGTVRDCSVLVDAIDAGLDPGEAGAYRDRYWQANRFDDAEVNYVKRMLQTGLPREHREALVQELFARFVTRDSRGFCRELYVDVDQLKEMVSAGMTVGSHSHRHEWLAHLPREEQELDILRSLELFARVGCGREDFTFCYPYGSYDAHAVQFLEGLGCSFAVTTVPQVARIPESGFLTLPRLDTNDLPTRPAGA